MGMKRILKWAIIPALLLAAGAYWYFAHGRADEPQYQSVTVARGDLTQVVTATGQLNPVTNVTVGSQISGNIIKLYADWNSPVKASQIIAELDPATYKGAVAQAAGDLANTKANLELAQVQARRSTELFQNNLISGSDYDTASATLHQAEAQVKIKQAALDNAKVNLGRCTIYSPVDGIVISRNVDVGQTVAASLSAPTLFIIANDLAQMQIDANVAEADIGGVEVGQGVDFTVDAFPYRTFRGKVTQIRNSPITVQNVVTYDTVIEVSNADLKLRPGMTANVSIIIARRENALKIPNAALRFRPPEAAGESKATVASPRMAQGGPSAGERPGGMGGPGGGSRNGSGRPRMERQFARTVYTLGSTNPESFRGNSAVGSPPAKPSPTQIKVGVSDGIMTEVVEGLKEGDLVATGTIGPIAAPAASPANPFGGGFRRF